MACLCQRCAALSLHDLFFDHFNSFARFWPLASEVEQDEILVTQARVVARQREGFLEDRDINYEQEQIRLVDYLDSIGFESSKDPSAVKAFFEDQLFAPLDRNSFARSLGTISKLKHRAPDCELCSILLDDRLWRIVGVYGENEDAVAYSRVPTGVSQAIAGDYNCYIFPIWPTFKVMWYDYFTTPNELCILVVPSGDMKPPGSIDDCFFDRRRDLRTLCLLDHPNGFWLSLKPDVDWDKVQSWLPKRSSDTSSNRQVLATLGEPRSQSFMLIDIAKSSIIHVPSLENISYAALSYVWGAARTSEKWCADIQQFHDTNSGKLAVPLSAPGLPARIQDALWICQQLKIPYLWVDSLCIPQNQGVEKQDAIADMGYIYMGCHLCIVAAADGGVHDPLLGIRTTKRHQSRLYIDTLTLGICPPPLREAVHQSKWNSRGWTFQESILSARCLVVLEDQIFLQDGRSIKCEAVDIDIGNDYENPQQDYREEPLTSLSLYDAASEPSSAFSIYKDMVQTYTMRELSFQTDVGYAFQGLAQVLQKRYKLEMYQALPTTRFAQSLNWFCPNAKTWSSATQGTLRRLNGDGQPFAPSWTWLSRIGAVSYTTIPEDGTVQFEGCTSHLPKEAMDSAYELPATGFEGFFATTNAAHSQYSKKLVSPIPVLARLYHTDHVQLIDLSIIVSSQLKYSSEHRYLLDNGDSNSLTGHPYIMPFAYQNSARENVDTEPENVISAALIVEVFEYPFVAIQYWPQPLPTPTVSSVATQQAPIKRTLTPSELKSRVFLLRRVGVIPYGFFSLKTCLPAEYETSADHLSHVILG